MARINLKRAIDEGRKIINPRYDMSFEQLKILEKTSDIKDLIYDAISFGYLQGTKAAKEEMRKGGATHA